jgi:uncharacterized protein (DUF433 family)
MKIEEVLQQKGLIHSDPEIMSGSLVFIGTRVPLRTFFDYLEGDEGLAEFINDFPYLETKAIQVLETVFITYALRSKKPGFLTEIDSVNEVFW